LSPTAAPSSREVPITLEFPQAIPVLDDTLAPSGSAAQPDNSYMSTLFCDIGNFASENGAWTLYNLDGRLSYGIPYEPEIQGVALCLGVGYRV
jgi:hypothetical protein